VSLSLVRPHLARLSCFSRACPASNARPLALGAIDHGQ